MRSVLLTKSGFEFRLAYSQDASDILFKLAKFCEWLSLDDKMLKRN